jgi:hypothetical protein
MSMNPDDDAVSCLFSVRIAATEAPTYRYESVSLPGTPTGTLHTPHPPLIGDIVALHGRTPETTGQFRVLDRAWSYIPDGAYLQVVVEGCSGLFPHEADDEDDEAPAP